MGRGGRWALGLVVSGVLGLTAVVCAAVALGQVIDRSGSATRGDCIVFDQDGGCADDRLTATAEADVLDVDATGANGTPLSEGGVPGESGSVDVEFDAPDQHVVTTIPWPGLAASLPVVGYPLVVAYAPDDPENLITVEWALDEKTGSGSLPPALSGPGTSSDPSGSPAAASSGSAWDDGRGAAWLTVGFGLATVVALLLTWLWARRAPAPERAPSAWASYPAPGYGYPPAGYPAAYGYPGPGYPAAGYGPAGYGPAYGYAGPGYPASGVPGPGVPGPGAPEPGPAPSGPAMPGAGGSTGDWLLPH